MKHTLLTAISTLGFLLPFSASAVYIDPYDAQAHGGFPYTYNARHAQDAVDYQRYVYDSRRGTQPQPYPSTQPQPPFALPPEEPTPSYPIDHDDDVEVDIPHNGAPLRPRPMYAPVAPMPTPAPVYALHLAHTGPAMYLLFAAMLTAVGVTMWKAKGAES